MLHLNITTLIALGLSFIAAPAAQWVSAQRDKVKAATTHLEAQAAAIKNPFERAIAEAAAPLAPVALNLAANSLQASRDHVVTEVSKVNPAAGALMGSLIDTALSAPATIAAPAPAPSTTSPDVRREASA